MSNLLVDTEKGQSLESSSTMTAGTIESDKDIGNSLPLELGDASQGVVVCFHRKMMPQEFYFLSGDKYSPSLFGIPLVIVVGAGKTTCQDLYKGL